MRILPEIYFKEDMQYYKASDGFCFKRKFDDENGNHGEWESCTEEEFKNERRKNWM